GQAGLAEPAPARRVLRWLGGCWMQAMPALRTPARRGPALVAGLAAGALLLSGCASASTALSGRQKSVQGTDTNVKMTNCAAQCTGEIDGAKYSIKLPQQWNGTL